MGIHGQRLTLGHFSNAEAAARLYDSASFFLRGAQADLNFPDEQPQPLSDELKARIRAVPEGLAYRKWGRANQDDGDDDDDDDDEDEEDDE